MRKIIVGLSITLVFAILLSLGIKIGGAGERSHAENISALKEAEEIKSGGRVLLHDSKEIKDYADLSEKVIAIMGDIEELKLKVLGTDVKNVENPEPDAETGEYKETDKAGYVPDSKNLKEGTDSGRTGADERTDRLREEAERIEKIEDILVSINTVNTSIEELFKGMKNLEDNEEKSGEKQVESDHKLEEYKDELGKYKEELRDFKTGLSEAGAELTALKDSTDIDRENTDQKFESIRTEIFALTDNKTNELMLNISGVYDRLCAYMSESDARFAVLEKSVADINSRLENLSAGLNESNERTTELIDSLKRGVDAKSLAAGVSEYAALARERLSAIVLKDEDEQKRIALFNYINDYEEQIRAKLTEEESLDIGALMRIKTEENVMSMRILDEFHVLINISAEERLGERINEANERIDETGKELESTKKDLENTKEELAGTIKDLENTKEDLEETGKGLVETKEELKEAEKDLSETKEELKETEKDLRDTKEDLGKTKEDLKDAKEQIEGTRENLSDRSEEIASELEKIQKELSGAREELSEGFKQAIENAKNDFSEKLNEIKEESKSENEEVNDRIEEIENRLGITYIKGFTIKESDWKQQGSEWYFEIRNKAFTVNSHVEVIYAVLPDVTVRYSGDTGYMRIYAAKPRITYIERIMVYNG